MLQKNEKGHSTVKQNLKIISYDDHSHMNLDGLFYDIFKNIHSLLLISDLVRISQTSHKMHKQVEKYIENIYPSLHDLQLRLRMHNKAIPKAFLLDTILVLPQTIGVATAYTLAFAIGFAMGVADYGATMTILCDAITRRSNHLFFKNTLNLKHQVSSIKRAMKQEQIDQEARIDDQPKLSWQSC